MIVETRMDVELKAELKGSGRDARRGILFEVSGAQWQSCKEVNVSIQVQERGAEAVRMKETSEVPEL